MNLRIGLAVGLMLAAILGGCQQAPIASTAPTVPKVDYRTNSFFTPDYVSPCAGGQPQMQYNCPRGQN